MMLSEKELQSLLDYTPASPVLSVYLYRKAADRGREGLILRNLLSGLPPESAADQHAIEQYAGLQPFGGGQSLAMFSCAGENFFRGYLIPLPMRDRARWLPKPYVKPLADLFDSYGGYGVAAVDKQSVRLFHFHLGELVESGEAEGEDIRRVKQGAGTSRHGSRAGASPALHDEPTVEQQNLRRMAEAAARFFAAQGVRRVMLAGTDETVSRFRAELPKTWQSLVVGTFAIAHAAPLDEILLKAMDVAMRAERDRETAVVDQAITGAAKSKGGVIGLEDTLLALQDGRVHTLLIRDGFRAEGFRCNGCGFLTVTRQPVCPFCQNTFTPITDAVEEAVEKTILNGGEVEVVRENPSLEKAGSIGAILRY